MNRGRSSLCCLLAVVVALAAAVVGDAGGLGCCCTGVCPLAAAMAKMGIECSMADGTSCSLERAPRAPASTPHVGDGLQPGLLAAAASLWPPAAAGEGREAAIRALPSVPHRPEVPPPRPS